MLDLSAEFDTPPTKAQLQAKANAFINANDLDTVARHYKVSFVPLWQTEEYKNLAVLERCSLCDTVTVVHEKEKVKAKIIKTVYDVLNERYISIEMGNAKSNVSNGNTLISSDIAEIKALKVYDTANSAFREFEFKRISVMNADTGNTELMRILVQKE
jgi:phage-related protein